MYQLKKYSKIYNHNSPVSNCTDIRVNRYNRHCTFSNAKKIKEREKRNLMKGILTSGKWQLTKNKRKCVTVSTNDWHIRSRNLFEYEVTQTPTVIVTSAFPAPPLSYFFAFWPEAPGWLYLCTIDVGFSNCLCKVAEVMAAHRDHW